MKHKSLKMLQQLCQNFYDNFVICYPIWKTFYEFGTLFHCFNDHSVLT